MIDIQKLKLSLEAVLLTSQEPVSEQKLLALFEEMEEKPTLDQLRQVLSELGADYANRSYELKNVASGFQLQVRGEFTHLIQKLWQVKPPRYSKALLETLAMIAYRQPITRGEIESVRGVVVSSHILKTLLDRQWVRVVGYKEVPGKPALYATTKQFLDYFNLKSLSDLPLLEEHTESDSTEALLVEQLSMTQAMEADEEPTETENAAVADSVQEEVQAS